MNQHDGVGSEGRGRGASRLTRVLQLLMALAAAGALYERQWLNAFVIASILGLTAMPGVVGRRIRVFLPPAFELAAVLFVFAALFLGEVRGYYTRFWWWDVVLHTSSGFLLGVLGFVLVFVLNREPHVQVYMAPSFVFLFSFTFALAVGALWEVFEFTVEKSTSSVKRTRRGRLSSQRPPF